MKKVLVGIIITIVLGGVNTRADFSFGIVENLGPPVNSTSWEYSCCISQDGLELYFSSLGIEGHTMTCLLFNENLKKISGEKPETSVLKSIEISSTTIQVFLEMGSHYFLRRGLVVYLNKSG
jgi:hypothetical protein